MSSNDCQSYRSRKLWVGISPLSELHFVGSTISINLLLHISLFSLDRFTFLRRLNSFSRFTRSYHILKTHLRHRLAQESKSLVDDWVGARSQYVHIVTLRLRPLFKQSASLFKENQNSTGAGCWQFLTKGVKKFCGENKPGFREGWSLGGRATAPLSNSSGKGI